MTTQFPPIEQDRIRCICGASAMSDQHFGPFIKCENCSVLQHLTCMGLHQNTVSAVDYRCEKCAPHHHFDTITALGKGEKIWLTRWSTYQFPPSMKLADRLTTALTRGDLFQDVWLRSLGDAGQGVSDASEGDMSKEEHMLQIQKGLRILLLALEHEDVSSVSKQIEQLRKQHLNQQKVMANEMVSYVLKAAEEFIGQGKLKQEELEALRECWKMQRSVHR